jgi:hypothetical protein
LTDSISYTGNQKAKEVKSTTVILSCGLVNHLYHRTQVANFRDGHWERHGSLLNRTDRYSAGQVRRFSPTLHIIPILIQSFLALTS